MAIMPFFIVSAFRYDLGTDYTRRYVFDYNRGKIFHIDVPINTQNEDIPNILEEYGLKESECNYMITEYPCKIINLTYEDKIVNKKDKI